MKSLVLFVLLYPLLQPVWEKEPLSEKNTTLPLGLTYLSEEQIMDQKNFFLGAKDARLRSRIVKTLSESNNPKVFNVLHKLLERENNDMVKEDILIALYALNNKAGIKKPEGLKELFSSDSPSIRAYSAALYLRETGKTEEIIESLKTERSLFVQNFLWKELAKKPDRCNNAELESHIKAGSSPARNGATYILACSNGNVGLMYPCLSDIASGDDKEAKLALALSLSKKKKGSGKLLEKLSEDKSATIRGIIASMLPGKERKAIQIKLAGDNDWEVRRLACVSLAAYSSDDAVDTLIKHLGDTNKQVRTASENSLVKIRPGKEAIEKIGECLDDKASSDSAIRVLGLLRKEQFGNKILEILDSASETEDSASKTETIFRCVNALGEFRFKKGCASVMAQADSEDIFVRQAVAAALGRIAVRKSFDTLVTLSKDPQVEVALEAMKSMGLIEDTYFKPRLYKVLTSCNADFTPPDMRAAACWSLARVDSPDKKTLAALERLALKDIIKTQMANMYDSNFVRIAVCFALIDMGKNDPASKKLAKDILTQLQDGSANAFTGPDFTNDTLKEFARQAELYMENKKPNASEYPFSDPDMAIKKIKKD